MGEKKKEIYYSLLSLKLISFALFPQPSLPNMNFNISEEWFICKWNKHDLISRNFYFKS